MKQFEPAAAVSSSGLPGATGWCQGGAGQPGPVIPGRAHLENSCGQGRAVLVVVVVVVLLVCLTERAAVA
jgi:hypothetical protein